MRIKGDKITKDNIEIIPIPRPNGDIIFKARVADMDTFDKMYPLPQPFYRVLPGGKQEIDFANPEYQKAVEKHTKMRNNWLILDSLSITPDLQWEKVDMKNPETWDNYMDELKESFTPSEVNHILAGIYRANVLDEKRIEEARQRFLASQQEQGVQPA